MAKGKRGGKKKKLIAVKKPRLKGNVKFTADGKLRPNKSNS